MNKFQYVANLPGPDKVSFNFTLELPTSDPQTALVAGKCHIDDYLAYRRPHAAGSPYEWQLTCEPVLSVADRQKALDIKLANQLRPMAGFFMAGDRVKVKDSVSNTRSLMLSVQKHYVVSKVFTSNIQIQLEGEDLGCYPFQDFELIL